MSKFLNVHFQMSIQIFKNPMSPQMSAILIAICGLPVYNLRYMLITYFLSTQTIILWEKNPSSKKGFICVKLGLIKTGTSGWHNRWLEWDYKPTHSTNHIETSLSWILKYKQKLNLPLSYIDGWQFSTSWH